MINQQQKRATQNVIDRINSEIKSYKYLFEQDISLYDRTNVIPFPDNSAFEIYIPKAISGIPVNAGDGAMLKNGKGAIYIKEIYQYNSKTYEKIFYNYCYFVDLYEISFQKNINPYGKPKIKNFSFHYDMDPAVVSSDHPLTHLSVITNCPRFETKEMDISLFLKEVESFTIEPSSNLTCKNFKDDPLFFHSK